MTPYYDQDGITIYHGDCLEVMPNLPLVDLVVTSPPYNLGTTTGGGFSGQGLWRAPAITYGTHDDAMPLSDYEAWQRDILSLCWERLEDDGAIFYNHKPRVQGGELWTPLALNPGLPVRQIIIWYRGNGMNFAPTHYLPMHEWIVIFAKDRFRLKSKGASGVGDVWRFPPETGSDHPAAFPIGLPARILETTTPRLVVDPFMGSGTTLRAAKNVGVSAIGIEVEERFCEMAVRRLAQGVLALAD